MRKHFLVIFTVISIVVIVFYLPHIYFWLLSRYDLVFLGRDLVDPADTYHYVSFIEQVKQGGSTIYNLYNDASGSYPISLTYLITGKVSSILGLSSIFAYHLIRVILFYISIILACLIGFNVSSNNSRFCLFVLLSMASIILMPPHILFIVAILLFLTLCLTKINKNKSPFWNAGGLVGVILLIIELKFSSVLIYTPAPSPLDLILSLGVLVPLGVLGGEYLLKKNNFASKVLLAWIFTCVTLSYSPLPFQRLFILTITAPLAILVTSALISHKKLASISVILIVISGLVPLGQAVKDIQKDNPNDYYYHISKDELSGLNWLGKNTNSKDTILSNWFFGNLIPGVGGRRVYLGHKNHTTEFDHKVSKANVFLLDTLPSATDFLKEEKISYIFLGVNDPISQYGFKPDEKPYLELVYSQGEVKIYKVNTD